MEFSEPDIQNQQQSNTSTGHSGGPHFFPHAENPAQTAITDADRWQLKQQINSESIPLAVSTSVFASGMNGALTRKFNLETSSLTLIEKAGLQPKWKPTKPRVKTFGMTFPDGLEFIPPKPEKEEKTELSQIEGPKAASIEPGERKKSTRLKPPANALSLEDRLFYLLQPPLQSWLAGQELIMPFEPFPYQYEGIAWLFS
ncbi:MAG: ATP-dependent helicase, partial [Planctomycetaceae bacterium]|nr:ATP-dependent helicase [Planctomycetaceae bacterium]